MRLEAPKPIRVLPEDVWLDLVRYVSDHDEDIRYGINDFGDLRGLRNFIISVSLEE